WWQACRSSIAACDALAGHGFWQPDWAMEDRQWGLRFTVGRELYPEKELWVTEAGCTDPEVSKHHRAVLYPRYCEILRGLGVKGAAFWLLEGTEEWEREQNAFFDEEMSEALRCIPRITTVGTLEVADLRSSLQGSGYPGRELSDINYLVIHHSGVDVDSTAEAVATYHVDTLGWPGIGYHFLIHWDGRGEYVGDMATVRYNVAGRNREVVGICLPGDFTSHPPTEAALASARDLAANLRSSLGRPLPAVGHRDIAVGATACPGDTWGQWRGRLEKGQSLEETLAKELAFSRELVRLLDGVSRVSQEFHELLGKRGVA
ncbi:MAG: peptidoglycan recognition family protein, partial [Chloroflexota bacterium]